MNRIAADALEDTPLGDLLAKNPRDRQVGGDHYMDAGVQFWDVVDTWPDEQRIGYHRGAVLQRVMRFGRKDVDLVIEAQKIAHEAEKFAQVVEKVKRRD